MTKISIKRVLLGVIIGGIFIGLIIYLIDYLFCVSVSIVVEFKPEIELERAQSTLLKYKDDITNSWVLPDGDAGATFEISVPYRIKGYFVKSKLREEMGVKSVRFGTIFAPLEPF